MKKGRIVKPVGTKLLGGVEFLIEEMNVKKSNEYSRPLWKVLKSKFNGGNSAQGINNSLISLLR